MVTPGRRFCGSGGEELLSDGPAKAASWSGGGCFWARKVGFFEERAKKPLPTGGILDRGLHSGVAQGVDQAV